LVKRSNYLATASLMVIIIAIIITVNYNVGLTPLGIVFAQSHNMMTLNNSSESPSNRDSFTATGEISSLIITIPDEDLDITRAFKVILTGDWNLNIDEGKVTNFAANFLASPMDGSRPHTHQIINLESSTEDSPLLLQNNSISINGNADIKINGVTVWQDADILIQIINGSIITIDPNDADTEGHFGDQLLYGIVTRIIS
jgi:hypothetical protein